MDAPNHRRVLGMNLHPPGPGIPGRDVAVGLPSGRRSCSGTPCKSTARAAADLFPVMLGHRAVDGAEGIGTLFAGIEVPRDNLHAEVT